MFATIYDFFFRVLIGIEGGTSYYPYQKLWNTSTFNIFGVDLSFGQYFCILASFITLIFIFVLCCLFLYKIIKLIGGLIR